MTNRPHTILIVDDEPVGLRMLEKVLSSEYNAITAESGQEALEVLKREPVSLLITDQNMPGMTGLDLLRLSREMYPDITCVLMSAVNDTSVLIDALTDIACVLKKPWDRETVFQKVRESIQLHERLVDKRQANDG